MDITMLLRQIFPPGRLKTSLVDRTAYAGDAGFYLLIPKAVVQPETEEEIAALFTFSRQHKVPLVFRAGGTSLSGQCITDGILVDIGKHWRTIKPLEQGTKVAVQPGAIGGMVNNYLRSKGRKIGPDPASINAAMMGGILSNNASGMCCGVANNSYHTLDKLRFMLPDGSIYDTAEADSYERFSIEQPVLFNKINHLSEAIKSNEPLLEKVRNKYRMKNTVGYSLNALVDFAHPLDILAHLMIGAEGTLGFISKAVMHTLPDLPFKSAAMLYFPNIYQACSAIAALKESGAEALELMDRNALRSVETLKGLPPFFQFLPDGAAALLCEYQAETPEALQQKLLDAASGCMVFNLLHPAEFTTDEYTRNFYWKIRKGMFPSVGAVRQGGSTVILEDVAFPLNHLANAVLDLQQLFAAFNYENAIIFGHAKEGNIHFVITQLLDTPAEIDRYDKFLRKVVELVLYKYDGTLKAEHGTGRNMAPFVEAEWGGEAYKIMKELKATIDPENLLNPGVIINEAADAHLLDLKQMPQVEEEVDKCIECGFCEHHCPSKDVTLTPRQRIQVRRQLRRYEINNEREAYKTLVKEYQYAGLDTCATDGLCQVDCPVAINTGELVKRLRHEQHGATANKFALIVAKHFAKVEWILRAAIRSGIFFNKIFGSQFMPRLTAAMRKMSPAMPGWWPEIAAPPKHVHRIPATPQVVYFSACIQRMMGNDANGKQSVQETLLILSERAGIEVLMPKDLPGHCCGQAFASKGYRQAAKHVTETTIDAMLRWTNGGVLPLVCDFTSCTYTLMQCRSQLSPAYQQKFDQLQFMDSVVFLQKHVLPALSIVGKKENVVLHPTCAGTKLGLTAALEEVAASCANNVTVPRYAGCCGMAGDRGFLFPELTKSASNQELEEAVASNASGYYSSAKTCEMSLTHFSGKPYNHIMYLVEEVSRVGEIPNV